MTPEKEATLTIQYNGKEYSGHYRVEGGLIKVHSAYGDKTTQLSSMAPKVLAEMLLREIIKEEVKK